MEQGWKNDTVQEFYTNGMMASLAGLGGTQGSTDGIGSSARFYEPASMSVDANGSVYIADTGNSTIRKGGFLPFVTLPLQSQIVAFGADASITVAVSGSLPIAYQWQLNGINVSCGTNSTLLAPHIAYAGAGTYSLILANACGATTSTVAALTVIAAPTITAQRPERLAAAEVIRPTGCT